MNRSVLVVAAAVLIFPTTKPGPVAVTVAVPQWVCHLVYNPLGGVKFDRISIPQSTALAHLWQARYPRDVLISGPDEPCREKRWWRAIRDRIFTPQVITHE